MRAAALAAALLTAPALHAVEVAGAQVDERFRVGALYSATRATTPEAKAPASQLAELMQAIGQVAGGAFAKALLAG